MRNSPQDLHKKIRGEQGERLARKYLVKAGYKIVKTNYRTPAGEADIVAKEGATLVFIEVKTRTGDSYGSGADAVDGQKRRRYVKIAQFYLLREKISDTDVRFDVIEVQNGQIRHIISAFGA